MTPARTIPARTVPAGTSPEPGHRTNVIPLNVDTTDEDRVKPAVTASDQDGPGTAAPCLLHGEPLASIAFDYGSTLSLDKIDHQLREKPVDPLAARALAALHRSGITLLLASNTSPGEMRWPALQQAGIDHLFRAALLSYPLGVRKPEPLFYTLVLAAAECPASQVLFVGDRIDHDVTAPVRHGMRAALVRPHGLRPGEVIPGSVLLIRHVRDLPALVEDGHA